MKHKLKYCNQSVIIHNNYYYHRHFVCNYYYNNTYQYFLIERLMSLSLLSEEIWSKGCGHESVSSSDVWA